MMRLPRQSAPFLYGSIQAAVTTAIATGIGVHQQTAFGMWFLKQWLLAWSLAWLAMLPVVIFIAPLIQRFVAALTAAPMSHDRS